jgi:outer membrane receptor for ferrienterochelin and colicins
MLKKILVFVFLNTMFVLFSYSQQRITGQVTDAVEKPLQNVTVSVKGAETEVLTNRRGNYEIEIHEGNVTLVFNKIGYVTKEINVDKDKINVELTVDITGLANMSFEELMNVTVVTASSTDESVFEAPATTVVISRERLLELGYSNLSEIFDDLPGMDVIRPRGDVYYKNYIRGLRTGWGDSYLIMLDGVKQNDLYYEAAERLAEFPISNIKQIEIVYGPASSIYGADAMMGVVNVISETDFIKNKTAGWFTFGSNKTKTADITYGFASDKVKVIASGRIDYGDDFPSTAENFEFLKEDYINDPALWGAFAENTRFSGATSERRLKSLDIRSYIGKTEIAAQWFRQTTGWGSVYAADKLLPNGEAPENDFNAYIRHRTDLAADVSSSSIINYHRSNLNNSTAVLIGSSDPRTIGVSLWDARSEGYSIGQDFVWTPYSDLRVSMGGTYEQKDVQKNFNSNSSDFISPDSLIFTEGGITDITGGDTTNFVFPVGFSGGIPLVVENRAILDEFGVYLNLKYDFFEELSCHVGFRYDDNSVYGSATSIRAGAVSNLDPLIVKLFYGESFNAPSPRTLYGSAVLGSNPNLEAEESKTIEGAVLYTSGKLHNSINVYYVKNENIIENFTGGAENLGTNTIFGFDYRFESQIPLNKLLLKLWGSYSYVQSTDNKLDGNGDKVGEAPIGDIAPHKLHLGVTVASGKKFSAALWGRYIDKRETIGGVWSSIDEGIAQSINPVYEVDGYFTMDFNVRVNDLLFDGVWLGLKVANILDTEYDHPGVLGSPNSGIAPVSGQSAGWVNSLLPQFGRTVNFTIGYRIQ